MLTKIDTMDLKRRIDLRELAGRFVDLRRESANESSASCPKCGGDDRLHVTRDWFFCRQCSKKRDDAIAFG